MSMNQFKGETIDVISSMATRHVLTELAEQYRRQSGADVRIESVGGVDAVRRVRDGEPFDVVVVAAEAIDRLSSLACIDPGSRADLARSDIAVAVRSGAPRPAIDSESALRETLLAARAIGYSTGPSGAHLLQLFARLGVAQTIASRIVQAPPGTPVGALVARGEVELGFQQLSELIHLPGIDVIGPLPPGVRSTTIFAGAVCSASKHADSAKALLAFLASPAAHAVKFRHGMEPVHS